MLSLLLRWDGAHFLRGLRVLDAIWAYFFDWIGTLGFCLRRYLAPWAHLMDLRTRWLAINLHALLIYTAMSSVWYLGCRWLLGIVASAWSPSIDLLLAQGSSHWWPSNLARRGTWRLAAWFAFTGDFAVAQRSRFYLRGIVAIWILEGLEVIGFIRVREGLAISGKAELSFGLLTFLSRAYSTRIGSQFLGTTLG